MSEKEILIQKGRSVKTRNLIEQASYTLKLAREDAEELREAGLTDELFTEGDTLLQEVTNLEGKQEISKDDITLTTVDVHEKLIEAKNWVKKAKLKAKRAFRLNKVALDDFYTVPAISQSVPNAIASLVKIIELNRKYDEQLARYGGGNAFADQGETLLNELQDIDSTQERTKKSLPATTNDLYHKQGLLFCLLKDIRDMGLEVFIGDSVKMSEYALNILNRGGTRRQAEEVTASQ